MKKYDGGVSKILPFKSDFTDQDYTRPYCQSTHFRGSHPPSSLFFFLRDIPNQITLSCHDISFSTYPYACSPW